ncbi:MAG: LacI family DNA-binding transcriptional regulator [Lachnospiraceae bacterium]
MVTIKDIARESGYSVTTVSRVLNKRRDVSPNAKKIIDEIVEKHHFVPNNNAKHLKQTKSRTIAILVKGTSNMLFANIVEEIQKMLEKTKYSSIVVYMDELDNEVFQAIQICKERKPIGIFFLGGNPDNFEELFHEVDVASVLVTNRADLLEFTNLSSVATDDVSGGKCAIEYLCDKGHRNIGIIGGDFNGSYTSAQRFKGCLEAFEENEIAFDTESDYETARFSYGSAYRAMERILARSNDLTAIFAMSDVMAIGAIRALIDHGYRVPEDMSVIGFDGTQLARYYNPKLTSVQQQYDILAKRSVEILFQLIELEILPIHEVVSFELIPGESVRTL